MICRSFRHAGIFFLALSLLAQPAAAQGRVLEPPVSEKEREKELEAAQEEKIFKRDGELMADANSPRRRRMGGDINPATIPNPWILVPDTYQVGSRSFHLFLLGYIKLDGLHDFQANGLGPGFPTHFLSSQIPPRGSPAAAKKGRSGFTVNSSRLQIAGSTPTDLGKVQILFDFNFDANLSGRPAFLVRQFYLDVGQLRFGKAWTTFINVDAIPETLDYEGANSLPEVRQGLIRWTQPLGIGRLASIPLVKDLSLVFAAEQADSQLTLAPGIQPRNRFPDFMMNLEWQRGNSSVWLAGLYRRLEASGRDLEVAGNAWGIQLTGNLEFDPAPYFQFGFIYGVGVSSYVQDTSYLDLDGMVTASGQLKLFPIMAAWVGVQHWWRSDLRSTVSYGYVRVSDDALRATPGDPDGIYKTSNYVSANLIYSPIAPLDIGIEYLFGNRINNNGSSGYDNRVQVSLILHFGSGPQARSGSSLIDRLLGRE